MADSVSQRSEREARLHSLAERLDFSVEKHNGRFTLIRSVDLSEPEREESLTLEQAEDLLETWKLRGLHGG